MSAWPDSRRKIAAGLLLTSAVVVSAAAAWRLELSERLPRIASVYLLTFGAAVLLSFAAGRLAPSAPARAGSPAQPPKGSARFTRDAAALGALLLFAWAGLRQGRLAPALPTLAIWVASLALGAVVFAFSRGRIARKSSRRHFSGGLAAALLVVLAAAAWTRLTGLESAPPVFGGDEANQALDGISLVREIPPADPFGTGWYSTMRIGMLPAGAGALLSKDPIAGPRLPYAVAGVLSIAVCAAVAGIVAGGWGALACAALLAFSPYHVHFSRLASVMILDSLFAALAALFVLAASRSESPLHGYLAGAAAGLSLYGYAGGRVIALTFLAMLPFVVARPASRRARRLLLTAMAAGFLLAALPNLRFAVLHYADWNARFSQVGIFNPVWSESVRLQGSAGKLLANQFLSGTIGLLCLHSTSPWYYGYPIVAPILLPALSLAGLGLMAGRRQYFAGALLALLAAGNLAGVILTVAAPTPQRVSSLVPVLAILGSAAIAGLLQLLPGSDSRSIPWRAAVGTLLIGGLLVRTFGGPPRLWDPSPGYGGAYAAFVQSAYEILRAPRYRGEEVFLHSTPYFDSSLPCFRYFLPEIRWVDVPTRPEGPSPAGAGLHLFGPEWISTALAWKSNRKIPFGIALAEPENPRKDIGYLLRLSPLSPGRNP